MAGTQVQRRRGTTAEHATFTGAVGELTVDLNKKTVVVHDGVTPGGNPLPTQFSPSFQGDTAVERDLDVGRDAAVGGALTVGGSPVVTEDSFPVGTVVGKDSPTGAALLPAGSVAERPTTPVPGMLRFNADAGELERYVGGEWLGLNRVNKAFQEAPTVTLASAGTVDIGGVAANTVYITGTVSISSLGPVINGAVRRVVFAAQLTLVHSSPTLLLPTGADILTTAGDTAEFVGFATGWRCIRYDRASGHALVAPAVLISEEYESTPAVFTANGTLTFTHGLGVVPKIVEAELHCIAVDQGYAIGDIVNVGGADYGPTWNGGLSLRKTASQVVVRTAVSGISIVNNSTGAIALASPAGWRLVVRALA